MLYLPKVFATRKEAEAFIDANGIEGTAQCQSGIPLIDADGNEGSFLITMTRWPSSFQGVQHRNLWKLGVVRNEGGPLSYA